MPEIHQDLVGFGEPTGGCAVLPAAAAAGGYGYGTGFRADLSRGGYGPDNVHLVHFKKSKCENGVTQEARL